MVRQDPKLEGRGPADEGGIWREVNEGEEHGHEWLRMELL